MVAAHSRWRAVAETSDLASVVGPRVRFLCLDADETHVVLGANTGSLYVLAPRVRGRDRGCILGRRGARCRLWARLFVRRSRARRR
jgi:hypothetical protein